MQFNTAVCLVLAGVAVALWGGRRGAAAIPILGGFLTLVSGLTIAEYLFRADFGIDQLLFHGYLPVTASHAGRIAPMPCVCFLLTGLALLLLGGRAMPRYGPLMLGASASLIVSVSAVALAGYAMGMAGNAGWTHFARISIYAAAGLFFIGSGQFLIAWTDGTAPGEPGPRWLPAPIGLAVFTGTIFLFIALAGKQDRDVVATVRADAEGTQNQIAVRMESRMHSIARMAMDWQISGAPTEAKWKASAASYVHDIADVEALEWIDSSHHVRWVSPMVGNGDPISSLSPEARRESALHDAERQHQPVITRIVSLQDGTPGFVIYAPIVVNGVPDGFLGAIFKADTCLQRYLPPTVADGEAISVSDGEDLFYQRDTGGFPLHADWVVSEKIPLHGAVWNLKMWPGPVLARRFNSPLPAVVLCAGLLGGLLLAAITFFAQRSSREAYELGNANTALQAALDTVKTLEGLLPICCYCKRVRDDSGYWSQIDTYLRKHTKASLSHSYCPECAVKFYEECGIDVPDKVKAEMDAGNYE